MKILFYRYNSICEPDVCEQFNALGLEVHTIEVEITKKNITNSERVDLISQMLSCDKYLFVFTINFFPAISDVCNIFGVPYVGWSVDSPLPELFSKSILNPCNRLFLFDRHQYEEFAPFNPGNIYHLPLGTNVSRWDNVIRAISGKDRKCFSHDISFVGSLYSEKNPYKSIVPSPYLKGYTEGLLNAQFNVQGANLLRTSVTRKVITELKEKLPKYFPDSSFFVKDIDSYAASQCILSMHCANYEREKTLSDLSKFFNVDVYTRSDTSVFGNSKNLKTHGGVSTLNEMPKIFNLSKINLNITLRAIETGVSLRVWDICGAGGFLMTNYQEELTEYLTPGGDYDYYGDFDELKEKCTFYLSHEDIRKRIALSGYEKVKKYHTYANRMPVIFESILKEGNV